ncbi:MAG: hypothetical protein ABRQ38_08650 [Candidatus Eremiobacterota bacterium]
MKVSNSEASVKTGLPAGIIAVKLSENPYGFPANRWLLYSKSANRDVPTDHPERSSFRLRYYLIEDKKIYFGTKKPVVYNQNNRVRPEEIQNYIIERREIEKRIPVVNYEYWSVYLNSL